MKELFVKLQHVTPEFVKKKGNAILLDTCFFVHAFEHQKEHELQKLISLHNVYMTSFNVAEFIHIDHKIGERVRERARHFLRQDPDLKVLDVPVQPGQRAEEKEFMHAVDPYLAEDVPDPSDGVLMAAAILAHATVLTKDKHDLFTVKLENYLKRYGLSVYKDFHELM
ncbi:MAG: PIN domain-containing protein [Nanoarchaeota archaeon]